ncbi:MAG TPA: hypothetical protein VKA85_09670 [Candidatus Limnocylindrales bacterium]|nr:hypothetical protein [Candidatus Limnocylindrales bacterium]
MITIDCPICDEPLRLEGAEASVRCDGCRVELEFAPDDAAHDVARAA